MQHPIMIALDERSHENTTEPARAQCRDQCNCRHQNDHLQTFACSGWPCWLTDIQKSTLGEQLQPLVDRVLIVFTDTCPRFRPCVLLCEAEGAFETVGFELLLRLAIHICHLADSKLAKKPHNASTGSIFDQYMQLLSAIPNIC